MIVVSRCRSQCLCPGAFWGRVVAGAQCRIGSPPFLSPCRPVIED